MINKVISGSALILVIGIGVYSYLQDLQMIRKIENFMNVGPRFTLANGHELCNVVREVALHSIGFQQSGLELPDCQKYLQSRVSAPTQLKALP